MITRAPPRAGGLGRGQPGNAGADDQHVAMDMDVLIAVGIAALGGLPSPAARRISGS